MSKAQLIDKLKHCNSGDVEADHSDADDFLLEYINDPDIKAAYDAVEKWYA